MSSYSILRCTYSSQANSNDEKPISRFPVPDLDDIPEDIRQEMITTQEKAGFIPNVFKTLAHRPAEYRAFVTYYNAVMDNRKGGNINKADKELIIVAVSAFNKCKYCIIAHGALLRIFSKQPLLADQVAANWRTADLDDRQKAILEFAMEVAQCQPLQDSHFDALYQHGLDAEDAWDIGAVVALFSLSNRMAFLTNMVPNDEFYLMGRIPKKPKS